MMTGPMCRRITCENSEGEEKEAPILSLSPFNLTCFGSRDEVASECDGWLPHSIHPNYPSHTTHPTHPIHPAFTHPGLSPPTRESLSNQPLIIESTDTFDSTNNNTHINSYNNTNNNTHNNTRDDRNDHLNNHLNDPRGTVEGIRSISPTSPMLNSSNSNSNTRSDSISTSRSVFGNYSERKMTFLLVDDTASNSKMLKLLLKKKGIECDLAANGLEAVTAYKAAFGDAGARRAAMYEVIFMDYTMPVMNGLDASTIIRSLGFTGLIVGLTGNALDDDVAKFIKAGADCVFAKPFREEHLSALLQFIGENGCESCDKIQLLMKAEQRTYFR